MAGELAKKKHLNGGGGAGIRIKRGKCPLLSSSPKIGLDRVVAKKRLGVNEL